MSKPNTKAERGDYMLEFLLEWVPKISPRHFDEAEYRALSYEELEERYYAARDYIDDKTLGESLNGE